MLLIKSLNMIDDFLKVVNILFDQYTYTEDILYKNVSNESNQTIQLVNTTVNKVKMFLKEVFLSICLQKYIR